MKKSDTVGIVGGIACLGMAYLDAGWRDFWAAAGIVLILWSIWTATSWRNPSSD